MGERRINFGSDGTDARYRVEDTGTGANFTLVEDLNGNTVVLQYDQTNLVGGVPLDLSGQDLLGTDIVDGANINLSDIAGENISVDTTNDELDGTTQQVLWDRLLIGDDFADNTLTNRDPPSTTASELSNLADRFRPVWDSDGGANFTIQATGSRIEVTTSGGGTGNHGAARMPAGLWQGAFEVSFSDVAWSGDDDRPRIGVSDIIDHTQQTVSAGNSIFYRRQTGTDQLAVVVNGTTSSTTLNNSIDWTNNHNIDIRYTANNIAEVVVDGTIEATDSSNAVDANYSPFLGQRDESTQRTLSAASVTASEAR